MKSRYMRGWLQCCIADCNTVMRRGQKKKEEKFSCTRSDPTYTSALWLYFQLSCVITVTHQQPVSRLRSHCSLFTNMVHLVPPTRNSRLHHSNGCLHQNLFFLSRFFSLVIVKGPKYKNTSPVQSVTFTDHSRHSFQNLLVSKKYGGKCPRVLQRKRKNNY